MHLSLYIYIAVIRRERRENEMQNGNYKTARMSNGKTVRKQNG